MVQDPETLFIELWNQTHPSDVNSPDPNDPYAMPNILDQNAFSEWLYGDYDERKLRQFSLLYSLPLVRNYMDYLLDLRSDKEYLDRYGLSYSDVHDPRKLRSTGSRSEFFGGALNFVSRNVEKLYR